MAGRFLFRKLSSRVPGSTSLSSAYASASTAAGELVTRRALEGGVRNIFYLFNGASRHGSTAAPNLAGTRAAAKYLNTLPCTRAASGIGGTASGMPSAITLKPVFVNSIGRKGTFSSSTSTNDTISSKAKWDNDKAVMEAKWAAWNAKQDAEDAALCRYLTFLLGSGCFIIWGCISMKDSGPSHCCSSCCKCQCVDKNPKTE